MQQSKEPSSPQSLLNERPAPAVQHSLPAGPSLSPLSYNVWREQGPATVWLALLARRHIQEQKGSGAAQMPSVNQRQLPWSTIGAP